METRTIKVTLDKAKEVIEQMYPEYIASFDECMKHTHMHAFNMFIMKKDILDNYSDWLFNILFDLEKRVDPTKYDQFHARFFGRVSELLLDVYIKTNELKTIIFLQIIVSQALMKSCNSQNLQTYSLFARKIKTTINTQLQHSKKVMTLYLKNRYRLHSQNVKK